MIERRRRALALLLALSALAGPQAYAQEQELPSRFDLGVDFNIGINMVGGHGRYEWSLASWDAGRLGVGALLGFHAYIPFALPYEDTQVSRFRATIRGSLTLGHTFHLIDRHLALLTHVFLGPSVHVLDESYRNDRRGIDERHSTAAVFAETGILIGIAYRFDDRRFGISFDALMPLYVVGKTNLLHAWFVSTPFFGLSFSFFH